MRIFVCLLLLSAGLVVHCLADEHNPFPGVDWRSGYIQVSNSSSLFYVLLRCTNRSISNPPLTIRLSGGPGISSTASIFLSAGPVNYNNRTMRIEPNRYAWTNYSDLLFVDQPAGVSFSIARDIKKMCRNEVCVAGDFYEFLTKWYQDFPEYEGRSLFITGVSYAGRYIPAIAERILRVGDARIALKGVAIGNGMTDFKQQILAYPQYMLDNGIIGYPKFVLYELITLICRLSADTYFSSPSLESFCLFVPLWFYSNSGFTNDPYDIDERTSLLDPYEKLLNVYLNRADVQRALGVSQNFNTMNDTVFDLLYPDIWTTGNSGLELLLSRGMKVALHYGDRDYVCSWIGGERLAESLNWAGRSEFVKTPYEDWKIGEVVKAQVKKYGKLSFVVVKGTGHTMFLKQNEFAFEFFKDLVKNA